MLDSYLPRYDERERHSIAVAAPPETVLRAVRGLRPRDAPLTVALMSLRSLPALVRRRAPALGLREPVIDQFLRAGFVLLADEPRELVLGAVGRFWTVDGALRRVPRGEFAEFAEPGYSKAAIGFRADGGRLTTETRVQATDAEARRAFNRYWRLIRVGSAAIRVEWLGAIKRRAESGANGG